jgi:enoyl-CoA hydratase/carnithine racemase
MTGWVDVRRSGDEAWVVLDRPEQRNAVTTDMLRTAARGIQEAVADGARVVVLTGAGPAFCAGADLREFAVSPPGSPAEPRRDTARLYAAGELVTAIRRAPVPVVAGMNGVAAGYGCSLLLACDLVLARQSARFAFSFAGVGLMPDGGLTKALPQAVGRLRAAQLLFGGRPLGAADAYALGLVSEVVADDAFDGRLAELAGSLAEGPTAAFAATKAAMDSADRLPLEGALAAETTAQLGLFATRDYAEGVAAFRERRPPLFTGA